LRRSGDWDISPLPNISICSRVIRDMVFLFNPEKYFKAVDSARCKYGEMIRILTGLEFDEPHRYPGEFEELTKLGFDFILGSVHSGKASRNARRAGVFVGRKFIR
jgi:histidinol phosphatase-like PHP family hydrolase